MTKQEIAIRVFIIVLVIGGGAALLGYLKHLDVVLPPDGEQSSFTPFPAPSPSGVVVSGPGGCASVEECVRFCRENPSACFAFTPAPPSSPLPSGPAPSPTGRIALPSLPLPTFILPTFSAPGGGTGEIQPTGEELAALEEFFNTLNLDEPLSESGPDGCRTPRECQTYCRTNEAACRDWLFSNAPL